MSSQKGEWTNNAIPPPILAGCEGLIDWLVDHSFIHSFIYARFHLLCRPLPRPLSPVFWVLGLSLSWFFLFKKAVVGCVCVCLSRICSMSNLISIPSSQKWLYWELRMQLNQWNAHCANLRTWNWIGNTHVESLVWQHAPEVPAGEVETGAGLGLAG